MYAKGGMKMYAKDGAMVKALKKYAIGGETDPVKKGRITKAGSGTVREMLSIDGSKAYYDGAGGVPKEGMPEKRSFTTPGTERKGKDISRMEPLKLRDHLKVLEASKLLKQSGVNSVITMSDAEILNAAKQKNVYDNAVNNANKSYKNEIARRKLRK